MSTRNLISLLEKDGFECYVMPLNPHGDLIHSYDGIKRVSAPLAIRALGGGAWHNETSIFNKIAAYIFRVWVCKNRWMKRKMLRKAFDKLNKTYYFDTIIACVEGTTSEIVSCARFDNLVAWIRSDYGRYYELIGKKRESFYDSYKNIVRVSEQTAKSFTIIYPEYANKTLTIPNPQDSNMILQQADKVELEERFVQKGKTLLSIGRFDSVKRFDQIGPIAQKLKNRGLVFKWYLIGDGLEHQRIADSIHDNDVEDCVVMLGAKANPYYYIKKADAMICLSSSEACPRVVNEAKILHTPTVSTDYPSIFEFIKDGETGLITSLEDMPKTIMKLMTDQNLYSHIKERISVFGFDNTELMKRIKSIL